MKNLKKGFSFIEILVVVTIIGVIAAIGTVTYTSAQKKSRDGRRKKDLQSLRFAIEEYRAFNLEYPGETCCSGTLYSSCGSSNGIDWLPADLQSEFPSGIKDPKNTEPFCYYYMPGSYELSAVLEKDNDGLNDGGNQNDLVSGGGSIFEIGSDLNLIT
ncbi:type IV pilin protein, partial [Patescibacteria group bacterium]